MKKTLVLGPPPTPRYSNAAVQRLAQGGFEVVPVGVREGEISGVTIEQAAGTGKYSYHHFIPQPATAAGILRLHPKPQPPTHYFQPGTENPELMRLARKKASRWKWAVRW